MNLSRTLPVGLPLAALLTALTGCVGGDPTASVTYAFPRATTEPPPPTVATVTPPRSLDPVTDPVEAAMPPTACPADHFWIGRVRGQVLDVDGTPLANEPVTLCGTACIDGRTHADGSFDIQANLCYATSAAYPHGVAFGYHGLGFHPDYLLDFNPEGVHQLDAVELAGPIHIPANYGVPSVAAPASGASPAVLTDGEGFALTVAPGTVVVDPGERLQVVRIPPTDNAPLNLQGGAPPVVLYAIGPQTAQLTARAPIDLPNISGLAPGTEVEIVAVGTETSGSTPPAGVLGKVDTGHVSADGLRVTADTGIPFLGWVGYRAARP